MTCDETRLLLPDYWSQSLSSEQEIAFEGHLSSCETCRGEAERLGTLWRDMGTAMSAEEPSEAVRTRFYETLAAYCDGTAAVRRSPGWAIAAGVALLLTGGGLGYSWREVAQLRGEVGTMRQLVALSLLQQQSASERLRGVSWAYQVEPPDTQVLTALLAAVNHDPNVNVRLAAVDALRPFASSPATRPMARDAAIQALSGQTSPLVQVALIDLLVDLKEKTAEHALRSVASDASADAGVRERAHAALETLQ